MVNKREHDGFFECADSDETEHFSTELSYLSSVHLCAIKSQIDGHKSLSGEAELSCLHSNESSQ